MHQSVTWLDRSNCNPTTGQKFVAAGQEFQLRGKLGDGAVGLVRKAIRISDGKQFAVKFLAPDPKYIEESAFADVANRFRREGNRGCQLAHEHLLEILSYEENPDGDNFTKRAVKNPFLVMECVQGRTLEHHIKKLRHDDSRNPVVIPQTLHIGSCIASALTELHRRHVVHRDVKPANIFVSQCAVAAIPQTVKLGDFGVTKWGDFKAAAASGSLTVSHQQGLGTLKYMSPEQAVSPKEVSVRSDMFSFGVTLFELFTGRILPSPHHVFDIMSARLSRGSVCSKLLGLRVTASPAEEQLFELILDMFLRSPSGRPTSQKTFGRLQFQLERMTEGD